MRKTLAATVLVLTAIALPAPALAAPNRPLRAMQQVCFASSDINTEIGNIRAMVITPATPTDARMSLRVIVADLSKIRTALPNANPMFRGAAGAATLAFIARFVPLARGILVVPGGPAPPARASVFTASATALEGLYKRTLAMMPC